MSDEGRRLNTSEFRTIGGSVMMDGLLGLLVMGRWSAVIGKNVGVHPLPV